MDATSDTSGGALGLAMAVAQAQAGWLSALLDEAVAAVARDAAAGEDAAQAWAASAARMARAWQQATTALGKDGDLGARLSGWLDQLAPIAALARRLDWPAIGARAQALAEEVLGQHGLGPRAAQLAGGEVVLPRSDPRFADPAWREQPAFALLHQLYLLLGEELAAALGALADLPESERAAMQGAALRLIVMTDPAAHGATRPGFWAQALATRGASLADEFDRVAAGMLHCTKDA